MRVNAWVTTFNAFWLVERTKHLYICRKKNQKLIL